MGEFDIVDRNTDWYRMGADGKAPPLEVLMPANERLQEDLIPLRIEPLIGILSHSSEKYFSNKERESFSIIKSKNPFSDEMADDPYSMLQMLQEPTRRMSPREEYIRGLDNFLFRHGLTDFQSLINTRSLFDIVFAGTGVLSTPGGAMGFVDGASLREPLTQYKDRNSAFTNMYIDKNMLESTYEVGYAMGFGVAIAREHGVRLRRDEIPKDKLAFRAFMSGLKGDTRIQILNMSPYISGLEKLRCSNKEYSKEPDKPFDPIESVFEYALRPEDFARSIQKYYHGIGERVREQSRSSHLL